MLDAASPLPLYHQLAEDLFAQIQSGSYGAGHKLPSEHELAERYGVGRPTVRQATDVLIRRGLLMRKRGSGTYVRQVPAHVDLFSLAGTLVSFDRGGIASSSKLLGSPPMPIERRIQDETHPLHKRQSAFVRRLSEVDGEPVLLEEIDFDLRYFPGLLALPLQGRSLSDVVQQQYRMRPESADQSFRVTLIDGERASLLQVEPGAPLLQVDRSLHFEHAQTAVFARMYCRTDRLTFSQRLQGNGNQHA
jgi:GntR family transcriptional regulator